MADRPNEFPLWAMIDKKDEITGQNNVLPPPEEKMLLGWARTEQPSRNWFNFLHRTTCRWLQYFDVQIKDLQTATGGGSSNLNTRIGDLESSLSSETGRIDTVTNAVGTVQSQLAALQSGASTNVITAIESGTGFASITETNCTFTIQVYPRANCGITAFLQGVGFRRDAKIFMVALNTDSTISFDTVTSDFKYPIIGHTASHLEAHITMFKGQ